MDYIPIKYGLAIEAVLLVPLIMHQLVNAVAYRYQGRLVPRVSYGKLRLCELPSAAMANHVIEGCYGRGSPTFFGGVTLARLRISRVDL